jgi:hypothetical protein
VQGKTKDKLILDLNPSKLSPPLNYYMLLVGLSRTKEGRNIRFMPLPKDCNLQYLKFLGPEPKFRVWFKGFGPEQRRRITLPRNIESVTHADLLQLIKKSFDNLRIWSPERSRVEYDAMLADEAERLEPKAKKTKK